MAQEQTFRKVYPLDDNPTREELNRLQVWKSERVRAVFTGDVRPPKAGEWYLSQGCEKYPAGAWKAETDHTEPMRIAELCVVELVEAIIRYMPPLPESE